MDGHFSAFSFVDQIDYLEPAVRIRGHYKIPAHLSVFPTSLVAEATGQLAAWAAMAAVDFTHRPVAGIAGRIDLVSEARPGHLLDLTADIQSVDTETVGYAGTASVDGLPIVRLEDCVGPMMPVEEFDDPRSLRDRFHLLRTDGARPEAFAGVAPPELEPAGGEPGVSAKAILRVPATAPFFADHFPRRRVFPGTLLMHSNLLTASALASSISVGEITAWVPKFVSDVKLRTFIPPGGTLNLEAKHVRSSESSLNISVESRINGKLIGSAEFLFVRKAYS